MRNLQLLHQIRVTGIPQLAHSQALCIDYDTKVVYCATADGLAAVDPSTKQVVQEVSLVEAGYLPADGSGVVVGAEHIADQVSVCIATGSGDVILWNTSNNQLECVGSVDQGLTAMGWSTDQELVVLATGQSTLIMMTREFDPVTEVAMFSDQFGEAEFVSVGWGKKETQFHGSEGKEAAVKKAEAVKPASQWDDKRPRICWHGDGQYFVVSAIHPNTGCRSLCVWTRECTLFSTSEAVDGAEQALGWKSTGNLITATQRKPNKHDIIFYEKNGLRHGEFTLPFKVTDVKVQELTWNTDSSILAIWLEDLPQEGTTSKPQSYIQLWTVGNYHYYLKQCLKFPTSTADSVASMCWDRELANRLHVVCKDGQYLQYTWSWMTDHSLGGGSEDLMSVAVIDGDKVLMTPFRQMVVPPPLSAYTLSQSTAVNQVIFSPPTAPNDLAVLDADGFITFYTFQADVVKSADSTAVSSGVAGGNGFKVQCPQPACRGKYRFEGAMAESAYPLKYHHVVWVKEDQLLLCSLNDTNTASTVIAASIHHDTSTLQVIGSCDIPDYVHTVAHSPESSTVVLQLTDGSVLKYDTDNHSVFPWLTDSGEELVYSPHKLCTQMDIATLGGQEVVMGLTDHYQLFVNEIEVASNCTSYALHDEFLLLTTYAHTCRCICRKTKLSDLPSLSDGKAHPYDETIRRVERGSRIVCVIPDDTKLILQMPRGNLETIHPRALVLSVVRKKLDALLFHEAFTLMRKHRLNLNLIYDHNPKVFLDSVDTFIHQVATPTHVNLFLSDLQEEDVTRTMYTAAYDRNVAKETNNHGNNEAKGSKIDCVCEAVRQALIQTDPSKYLLSILTTYVKMSVPQLDTALQKVKQLKSSPDTGIVSATEALNYLLFLVDVNELYDIALGTYDFELVMMVAEKSQKDPKEYIPFLNNLRQMEENYMKYSIDKHLKRYTKALDHIIRCGDERFDECLDLVKENRLYREALKLYKPGASQYKDISGAYGSFLLEKKHTEEAGLVFTRAEAWSEALDAFEQSLSWRLALSTAYRAGHSDKLMNELCHRLASHLKEQSRHQEAAVILEQHLNDIEEAIVTLVEGSQWEEAIRLMYKYQRTDFIETHLLSALRESTSVHITLFTSVHTEFERHKLRLATVRAEKVRERLELIEGEPHNMADADLFSDTSSATGESAISGSQATSDRSSVFSKRTGRSSKTRRKQERKKWSLKEGSMFEDIALLEALGKTCKHTEDWRGDVAGLLKMLLLYGLLQEAEELQQTFDELLILIEKSTSEIWPVEQEETSLALGPDSTANTIAQAVQRGSKPEGDMEIHAALKVAPVLSRDNKWKLHSTEGTNR